MNIGVILAILLVLLAVAAGVLLGNTDVSSPTLAAHELSQGAPGAATSTIIFNQIVGVLLGILVTGVVAGVAGVVYTWLKDWYESRQKGDWEPGPNAGWRKRAGQRQQPLMTRDEIFQLAMLNAMTQGQAQRYLPQINPPGGNEADEDPVEF